MVTFTYPVVKKMGLHARPAALFAENVRFSGTKVTVSYEGKTVDASKMKNLLNLGIKSGTEMTVTVEGEGEEEVAQKLKEICEGNL